MGAKSPSKEQPVLGTLMMRVAGLVLTALLGVTLYSTTMTDEGIGRLGYAYLAGRWSNVWWQLVDLLAIWLVLLHGSYGMVGVLRRIVSNPHTRFWLTAILAILTMAALALGTLVITTFDPAAT